MARHTTALIVKTISRAAAWSCSVLALLSLVCWWKTYHQRWYWYSENLSDARFGCDAGFDSQASICHLNAYKGLLTLNIYYFADTFATATDEKRVSIDLIHLEVAYDAFEIELPWRRADDFNAAWRCAYDDGRPALRGHRVRLPFWCSSLAFAVYPIIVMRRFLVRWERRRKGQCERCGYSMHGNITGRCSECGAWYNADQKETA